MIVFFAIIALIVIVIGLACYQTIMDNKINKLKEHITQLDLEVKKLSENYNNEK